MIAGRLLWREMVSGRLTLLAFALIVSVAAMTTTAVLTDRIDGALRADASSLLGGDLKISGPRPLPEEWLDKAREYQLEATETIEFPTVIGFDLSFELAGLKVVSDGYPLRGALEVSDSRVGIGYPTDRVPRPGNAWADPQLASKLGLSVGDSVSVGETILTVAQILVFEPDRGGSFVSLSPRLMVNRADLNATELIQPGSRVRYITLFAGDQASDFKLWSESRLDLSQRIRGVIEGRPEVGSALIRATTYLSLAGLLTVLLSGAAIAMTANRWALDHISDSALFRTLGLTGLETLAIFATQLMLLGAIASGMGVLIGYGFQLILVDAIGVMLDITLPPPGIYPAFLGIFTGLCTLVGFAAPALALLAQVPPIRVFKRDFKVIGMGRWLRYFLAVLSIVILGAVYSQDVILTAWVAISVIILFFTALVFGQIMIRFLIPFERLGLAWRFGIRHLIRDPANSGGQLMAFSMTGLAIAMVALIRFDLIQTWQAEVPDNAPNTFALNITEKDVKPFELMIQTLGGEVAPLYPIVRGRLETVNRRPILEHLSGEEAPGAVRRELSLTESGELGRDNVIDRGRWFIKGDEPGLVTVESKLFDKLHFSIGDVLTYTVGPDTIEAKIIGTRTVKWESMLPNFFMIFSPGTFDALESTRLTSISLPNPSSDTAEVSKAFRQVTLLSIDAILEQVRGILDRVAKAVNVVLYFVLLGGILVLVASIQTSLPERRREAAILRSLGGSDRLLSKAQWSEFLVLGFFSGLLAALGTEVLGRLVYTQIFKTEWPLFWWIWIVLPSISAGLVGLVGRWSARQARLLSPSGLLKISES